MVTTKEEDKQIAELLRDLLEVDQLVRDLADSDPIAWVVLDDGYKNLECILCHGEIPLGHTKICPWWRAKQWKEEHP